jgi:hypothetical protein
VGGQLLDGFQQPRSFRVLASLHRPLQLICSHTAGIIIFIIMMMIITITIMLLLPKERCVCRLAAGASAGK